MKLKQGDFVQTSEELLPFYWNYAGTPNIRVHPNSVGVVAHPSCFGGGDVIIDFPIDTSDLKVQEGYADRPIDTVWRVRLSKAEAKTYLKKVEPLDWLKHHFFCGSLILDCELPRLFNRFKGV